MRKGDRERASRLSGFHHVIPRVLIVASSVAGRGPLESRLAGREDLAVVAALDHSSGLGRAVEALQPDVAVVEAPSEPGSSEWQAWLADVAAAAGLAPVLVLSERLPATWEADLLREGVGGILSVDATETEIGAAVNAVLESLVVLHAGLLEGLLPGNAPVRPPTRERTEQRLTARETEVLRMLAEGAGNKQIAARLGVSDHTVKFHLTSIFSKLDVSTRTEAVTAGVRRGLIML